MRFWVLALVACVGLGAWHLLPLPTAGALAPMEPEQQILAPGEVKQWNYRGEIFHPLARYNIKARLLSRELYLLDSAARISPVDFALGWGRMSDPGIYRQLGISQGGRWYEYHWSGSPPIPGREISRCSANTHLIPANLGVLGRLLAMKEGDVVSLGGYLVQVQFPTGGTWTSSLSREDTGAHACEVMWVNAAAVVGR